MGTKVTHTGGDWPANVTGGGISTTPDVTVGQAIGRVSVYDVGNRSIQSNLFGIGQADSVSTFTAVIASSSFGSGKTTINIVPKSVKQDGEQLFDPGLLPVGGLGAGLPNQDLVDSLIKFADTSEVAITLSTRTTIEVTGDKTASAVAGSSVLVKEAVVFEDTGDVDLSKTQGNIKELEDQGAVTVVSV